jgi:peptidylprolyl isomerase
MPKASADAIANADAIPSVVVLEYNESGAPTNYFLPPADAVAVASGGKSLIVGKRQLDAPTPQEFDVAVLKMNAWNHKQVSMMGESAGQEFRIPVFDAPEEIREVIQSLHVGEKARIWVDDPASKGATAVMDMELVKLVSPPKAPGNLVQAPEEATTLEKGLRLMRLEEEGPVDKPEIQDAVTIEFTSWDHAGKVLDSSIWSPGPTTVELKSVPEGIRVAILTMSVGEKFRMWIPKELHDGENPIVTDMRLLTIDRRPKPIPAPEDVAAAPKKAKKTKSGLRYQILQRKASSRKKPKKTSEVEVHYTGWTTDGVMFDSSVTRGTTASFPLDRVIPGWTEGLQLMRPGQRFRFWIPEALAYQGKPGMPAGMLVFDVQLIQIKAPETEAPKAQTP